MVVPLTVVLLATRDGIFLSPDSQVYLATAESLVQGRGLDVGEGQPLTLFPPGLPVLLAGFNLTGSEIQLAALLMNLISLIIIIVSTYLLTTLVSRSWQLGMLAAAFVSLSSAFTGVFIWLWTEPLFTALATVTIGLLVWAIRWQRSPLWLLVATGLLISAAFAVRYVGLLMLPVVAVGIWWANSDAPVGLRIRRLGVSVVVGSLAPVVVITRNLMVGSAPLGDRLGGGRTIQSSSVEFVEVIGTYVLPRESSSLAVVAGILMCVLVCLALWQATLSRDHTTMVVGLYVTLFAGFMVVSQASTRLDAPSARLLAPLLPAFSVLLMLGARAMLRRVRLDIRAAVAGSPHSSVRAAGYRAWMAALWTFILVAALVLIIAAVRADQRLIRDGPSAETMVAESRSAAPALGAYAR